MPPVPTDKYQYSKLVRSRYLRDQHGFSSATTPPQTRKRKAAEVADELERVSKQSKTKRAFSHEPADSALNTPPLTTMDSDDEFLSGLSSQDEDFGTVEESDDGSLGDGK